MPAYKKVVDGKLSCTVNLTDWPEEPQRIILSGSFNPLHAGHLAMAEYAEFVFPKCTTRFELSVTNCSKAPLTEDEVVRRVRQFDSIGRFVYVTRYPFFVQKAIHLPKSVFLVGIDTIERIADLKYYFNSEYQLSFSCKVMQSKKCSFIVFPRNGKTLGDLILPPYLQDLCLGVGKQYKPVNISSTELRSKK